MNATNAKTTTASDAYKAHANDIARLIDVLQMELERHAKASSANPNNWGNAGDLGKFRSDLIDTIAFVSGMNRSDIEDFLAE